MPKRIIDILGEIFYTKRYMLQNLLSWLLASQKFLMSVHYFACGWVLIHELRLKWNMEVIGFKETEPIGIYFESFYLMTTTISTVGYGDYGGFNGSIGEHYTEMLYLSFVTLVGILLFSSVTNEIFNYEQIQTVGEIV